MQLPVYEPVERMRLAACTLAAVMVAGCGLQGATKQGPATLTVTENFGARHVAAASVTPPAGGGSALALTGRRIRVSAAAGAVSSIAGVPASGDTRWFLYVNGVAAPPRTRVRAGEHAWWDLHSAGVSSQAVVGAFPEPFVHGLKGKRLPVTVACGAGVGSACRRVQAVLAQDGVPTAGQTVGASAGAQSLTIEVATWPQLRGQVVALLLARGPALSGVFARFDRGGGSLELLDSSGTTATTLSGSAGLITAVAQPGGPPTWLVTGTDDAGVAAAANAFDSSRLHDHFALAVARGRDLPVPR